MKYVIASSRQAVTEVKNPRSTRFFFVHAFLLMLCLAWLPVRAGRPADFVECLLSSGAARVIDRQTSSLALSNPGAPIAHAASVLLASSAPSALDSTIAVPAQDLQGCTLAAPANSVQTNLATSEIPPIKGSQALVALGTVQAAFSPGNDIEGLILSALTNAKQQILVQAYLLTSNKIIRGLISAKQRGVEVLVLLDGARLDAGSPNKTSKLVAAGIPVWLETAYENAHNKVIVIDVHSSEPTLITGSFNFTWTAQHRNAENLLVIRGHPELACLYAKNWKIHQLSARAFKDFSKLPPASLQSTP